MSARSFILCRARLLLLTICSLTIPLALPLLPGRSSSLRATEISILRIEQVTSGMPGSGSVRTKPGAATAEHTKDKHTKERSATRQVLWVDLANQRVRLEQYDSKTALQPERVFVLQPDPNREGSLAWEFPGGGKRYREHRDDFNKRQRDRLIHEQEMIRIIRSYPRAERKKALADRHLRLDGKRIVDIGRSPTAPRLGKKCERTLITENGRTILDADIATIDPTGAGPKDSTGASSTYFELYRRLGVFSDEVLEKLHGIHGLPLRAEITVVTELVPYTITTEVEKLEDRKVPETFFDLPAGAEQIPDVPPIHNCPVCRARFETLKGVKFVTPDGESVYLCSPECFEKIRAASRRRPKRQSP